MTAIAIDPFPPMAALTQFWEAAWGHGPPGDYAAVLKRSLAHFCAYDDGRLVGFVNIAWDGGLHAFILDTAVTPDMRRRGIATALVRAAAQEARARGAHWLHVDFEPQLEGFYRGCGFEPTLAGLMRLTG